MSPNGPKKKGGGDPVSARWAFIKSSATAGVTSIAFASVSHTVATARASDTLVLRLSAVAVVTLRPER